MKKILILNNDLDTMSLIKMLLETSYHSYQVEFTGNKDIILETIANFQPDLLLVDVLQKESLQVIRTIPEFAEIPVILMSGYSLRNAAEEVDVDDVIEKPFDVKVLEEKIEAQLRGIDDSLHMVQDEF
jgi:DNA-binding response OmpR family regulator